MRSDFSHPFNPGNVLGYNPAHDRVRALRPERRAAQGRCSRRTGALYTDRSTRPAEHGRYHNWLLNFDYTEGPLDTHWIVGSTYAGVPTDGDDMIFGDLGNDWLVGGTGRDMIVRRLGRRPGQRRRPAEHEQRPERPHRHEPVVRGPHLRRRRPRRADRQHRRRPADRLGRRVQHATWARSRRSASRR